MLERSFRRGDRRIEVRFTERADGDFTDAAPDSPVAPVPVQWLRQRHGRTCAVVHGAVQVAPLADAAVTADAGLALAVRVADCAPIALWNDGAVAVVHAGWRGLVAGVIDNALVQLERMGAGAVDALVGPCIKAECYEFGATDLALVEAVIGPAARGSTRAGGLALDLPGAVRAALERRGVTVREAVDRCTADDAARCYSHRARGDRGRHALVVWQA